MMWVDEISADAISAYADGVESALSYFSSRRFIDVLSSMRKSYISYDGAKASAALEIIEEYVSDAFVDVMQCQDAKADDFCRDALGISPIKTTRHSFDASELVKSALIQIGEGAGKVPNERFALCVSRMLEEECIGEANMRVAMAVRYNGLGPDVRFAYVPTSRKVCGFCCMHAAHGFHYSHYAKKKLHDGCRCLLVPGIDGRTMIAGYSSERFHDGFEALVKRDAFGRIVRSDAGWPLFKDGMKYDAVACRIVKVYERFCHPEAIRVKDANPKAYAEWMQRVIDGSVMLSQQQQNTHYKSSNEYKRAASEHGEDPSYFNISEVRLQRIVMRCSGYGFPNVNKSGDWDDAETCFSDEMDALTMYNGNPIGTHAFKIHYSKERCHAVPIWEEKYRDHGSS